MLHTNKFFSYTLFLMISLHSHILIAILIDSHYQSRNQRQGGLDVFTMIVGSSLRTSERKIRSRFGGPGPPNGLLHQKLLIICPVYSYDNQYYIKKIFNQ